VTGHLEAPSGRSWVPERFQLLLTLEVVVCLVEPIGEGSPYTVPRFVRTLADPQRLRLASDGAFRGTVQVPGGTVRAGSPRSATVLDRRTGETRELEVPEGSWVWRCQGC